MEDYYLFAHLLLRYVVMIWWNRNTQTFVLTNDLSLDCYRHHLYYLTAAHNVYQSYIVYSVMKKKKFFSWHQKVLLEVCTD